MDIEIVQWCAKTFRPTRFTIELCTWHKWFAWYPVEIDLRERVEMKIRPSMAGDPFSFANYYDPGPTKQETKIVWLRPIARCFSPNNRTGYTEITNPHFKNLKGGLQFNPLFRKFRS